MKVIALNKIFGSATVLMLLVSVLSLSSCNPRQARIASKVLHDIEHASEHSSGRSSETYSQPQPAKQSTDRISPNARFAISGIFQRHDNGQISVCNKNVVGRMGNALYLLNSLGNPECRVSNNDIATITEVYVVRYSFDEDELGTRPYDVSSYMFKCSNSDGTYFFNITREL